MASAAFDRALCAALPGLRARGRKFARPQDLDDLVHDTVVQALTSRHTYKPEYEMMAWLYTIMRHLVAHRIRYGAARREVLCDLPHQIIIDDTPTATRNADALFAPDDQHRALEARELLFLVSTLPAHYAQAIGYAIEGLSVEEQAEAAGVTRSSGIQRLHRARRMMRQMAEAA